MWIVEPSKELNKKVSSHEQLNFLFNHENFYFMDNHLAAAWCWLQKLDAKSNYNFFHIDQHPDLLCDAPIESFKIIKEKQHLTIEEYLALNYFSCNTYNQAFSYDNYIIQTKKIFPNWFEICYFACPNYVRDDNLNIEYNAECYGLSTNISSWVNRGKQKSAIKPEPYQLNKWILNIDIDYFFNGNKYQLFTDDFIKEMCADILKGIDDIEVITIALSPECCGGWDKSYRIAKLMADSFGIEFSIEEFE